MELQEKSSRLFQSDFWERTTHVHHNTPFFIYIPIMIGVLLYTRLTGDVATAWISSGFVLGMFNWTWFEYVLHRFVFHYEPKSEWGRRFHYLFHGIHHDFPGEKDRLVMPPLAGLMIAVPVFGLHYGLLESWGLPLFAGFLAGYLYYEFVHYSVHHKKKIGWSWTGEQRKNHLNHHFKDAGRRFGVTSPLWDFVFGTYQ
ncbi:MAG: sterol desaturase family protein [Deltaproteobacteria bacterium]|nr:sterol desaturase family protein [Deltaproteobacteria bacterium]MBI4224326.1 sterol desaturase family protein [Deltaproteobacteria bacterium]